MREPVGRRDLRASYDRSAPGYDRRFEPLQRPKYDAILAHLTLPPEGRVLDLGCGTGLLGARLAPREVVGLDLSLGMLREGRGRLAARVQGDCLALPFEDRSFAAVLAVTSLLVPEALFPRALSEVARVLLPGGVAAITLLRHDVPEGFAAMLECAGLKPGERFECGQDLGWVARVS